MKEKNAHSAMSGNKLLRQWRLTGIAAMAVLFAGFSSAVWAQSDQGVRYAPALYELKEILVNYPYLADPKASSDCGLTRESVLVVLQRNLQDPVLETMILHEKHQRIGSRVDLTVEITTAKSGQSCLSWIRLPFVDKIPVVLPPVDAPRIFTLLFWDQSRLVQSDQDRHLGAVNDMIAAMARQFLRDVKLAMPTMVNMDAKGNKMEADKAEKEERLMRSINNSVSTRLINDQPGVEIPVSSGSKK